MRVVVLDVVPAVVLWVLQVLVGALLLVWLLLLLLLWKNCDVLLLVLFSQAPRQSSSFTPRGGCQGCWIEEAERPVLAADFPALMTGYGEFLSVLVK